MGEFNPFVMDAFSWDVLNAYIKHGYGEMKLYHTTFFSCHLTDETVCMTLQEFYDKAVTREGNLWKELSFLWKEIPNERILEIVGEYPDPVHTYELEVRKDGADL